MDYGRLQLTEVHKSIRFLCSKYSEKAHSRVKANAPFLLSDSKSDNAYITYVKIAQSLRLIGSAFPAQKHILFLYYPYCRSANGSGTYVPLEVLLKSRGSTSTHRLHPALISHP